MDTIAIASGSGQGSRSTSTRGRKSGTSSWLPIEGVVAYFETNHSNEKVSESSEQEHHVNAKANFGVAIVKMGSFGL